MQTHFYNLKQGDLVNVSMRGVKFFNQGQVRIISFIILSDHHESYDENLVCLLPTLLIFSETHGTMLLQMKTIEETHQDGSYQYLTYRCLEGYANDDYVIESLEMICASDVDA